MFTERCVKWEKEAAGFFESAESNSLVLNVVVSHGCLSQTGEGFEELANAINDEKILEKIKKIIIRDTSYLYRHSIPEFSKYSDLSIPTEWFLKNKDAVEKIKCEVEIKSWFENLGNDEYKRWYDQIKQDFVGDKNGNHIVEEFREAVLTKANEEVLKSGGILFQSINFILEECAYTCAFFQNINMVYPMNLGGPLMSVVKRYNLNINSLNYRTSNHEQRNRRKSQHHKNQIDQEIILFMNERSINVNFFVIDRDGNFIYKNEACNRVIEHDDAKKLPSETWKNTLEVMQTRKQTIVEERSPDGTCYLSVKSPLIIDEEIEGIIGLAVDITDRKKALELEQKTRMQEIEIRDRREFGTFTAQILHDITSPLLNLEFITKSADIPEKHHITLKGIADSLRDIVSALSEKYKEYERKLNATQEKSLIIFLALEEAVRNKKYQQKDIRFNNSLDLSAKLAFIEGDRLSFSRMISNLINNAVEACDKNSGIVEVSYKVEEDGFAKIVVKDNGNGMPKEMIDKIKSRSLPLNSTKHSGAGLGLNQILATIDSYKGTLEIESEENVGTAFSLKFPIFECPKWITWQLVFKEEDVIVILDDDNSIFSAFEELLKEHSDCLTLKFFTKIKDALNFIESFSEKEKIFFLSDYELRGGDFNGLTVIMQSGLAKDRTCILTGAHSDKNLQDMAMSSNVKILLKQFLNDILISVSS